MVTSAAMGKLVFASASRDTDDTRLGQKLRRLLGWSASSNRPMARSALCGEPSATKSAAALRAARSRIAYSAQLSALRQLDHYPYNERHRLAIPQVSTVRFSTGVFCISFVQQDGSSQ